MRRLSTFSFAILTLTSACGGGSPQAARPTSPPGPPADLRAVTLADVKSFVSSHLTPNGMTVVAAGDVTLSELEAELTEAFGSWKGAPTRRPPAPAAAPAPERSSSRVFLVDWPGAAQTHVAVVAPGISRSSEHYAAAMVWSRILGGSASSRLGRNLREQRGLTYWVWSAVNMRHGGTTSTRSASGP